MLMVGAKVLFNSAKMLKMGVLVVFMHDYGCTGTRLCVLDNLERVCNIFYYQSLPCDDIRGVLKGPECYFSGRFSGIADFVVG